MQFILRLKSLCGDRQRGVEAKFNFNYLNFLGRSNNKCDRETGKFEGSDLQLFTPKSLPASDALCRVVSVK